MCRIAGVHQGPGKRGCSTPGKKIRGCAAPPGNLYESPKGLKFWRKGSNIDEATGAAPCFFLLVREVGDVRSSIGTLLCVWKIDQKKFEVGKKMCQSSLP